MRIINSSVIRHFSYSAVILTAAHYRAYVVPIWSREASVTGRRQCDLEDGVWCRRLGGRTTAICHVDEPLRAGSVSLAGRLRGRRVGDIGAGTTG